MIGYDEAGEILDKVAGELPQEIFDELNGGIILLPEAMADPVGRNDDLFILGEYISGGGLGRYIKIYYGSFERLFGDISRERFKRELEKTLKHELTHHLESLAGARDLEKEDDEYLYNYLYHPGGQIRRRKLKNRK